MKYTINRKYLLIFSLLVSLQMVAQTNNNVPASTPNKPKLVVGIVVDQMRWDYLYRFQPFFKDHNGFSRLMDKGFSCENTFVNYLPTVTAAGHACIYTGSVPAIHGITGNNWWDNYQKKGIYCTQDDSVKTVGSNTADAGKMSPKNLLTTTITDELRLASNFHSKVVGLSLKDRGAIIPAGHSDTSAGHVMNAAFWYDGQSGNFITSTYYMNELPVWLQDLNNRKLVDSFYTQNWNLALPKQVYDKFCDKDENPYEARMFNSQSSSFPYNLEKYIRKDYSKISGTPYGNDLLLAVAKQAIDAEQLGKQETTDFLALSFSAPDYIGHSFGPNSWELFDSYIRLDATIASLLNYLDQTVGKDQYTVVLTADHAGAHIPEFLEKHNIPAGRENDKDLMNELNTAIAGKYGVADLVTSVNDFDIYLNHEEIAYIKKYVSNTIDLDEDKLKDFISDYLLRKDEVLRVVDFKNVNTVPLPSTIREMLNNAYNPVRSGDLEIIMKSGVMSSYGKTGMSHGVWYNYDTHIPLLWYGAGINQGTTNRHIDMTDIAPTIAALLKIQPPSGSIGKVISEVIKP